MSLTEQEIDLGRKALATAGAIDDGVRQFKNHLMDAQAAMNRILQDVEHFRQLMHGLGLDIAVSRRLEEVSLPDASQESSSPT